MWFSGEVVAIASTLISALSIRSFIPVTEWLSVSAPGRWTGWLLLLAGWERETVTVGDVSRGSLSPDGLARGNAPLVVSGLHIVASLRLSATMFSSVFVSPLISTTLSVTARALIISSSCFLLVPDPISSPHVIAPTLLTVESVIKSSRAFYSCLCVDPVPWCEWVAALMSLFFFFK